MKIFGIILGMKLPFFPHYKILLKLYGPITSSLLCYLINYETYAKLTKGYFYRTRESIEKDTKIRPHQQRKAFKELVAEGILEMKKVTGGSDPKNYYKINEMNLAKIILGNTHVKIFNTHHVKNFNLNNNINNKSFTKVKDKNENKFSFSKRIIKRRKKEPNLTNPLKTKKPLSTFEDIVINFWNKKMPPYFSRAKINSASYKQTQKYFDRFYRRDRNKVYDVFEKALHHKRQSSFIFKNKISLSEFFRITPDIKKYSPFYVSFKYSSWYDVFKKLTDEEIYSQFHKNNKKDKNPDITKQLEEIFIPYGFRKSNFTPFEQKQIILASEFAKSFCEKNDLKVATVIKAIDKILENKLDRSPSKIGYEDFWKSTIPAKLIDIGIFRSRKEIK